MRERYDGEREEKRHQKLGKIFLSLLIDPHLSPRQRLWYSRLVRMTVLEGWNILRNKTKGTKKRNRVLELKEKRESLRPERRRGPPAFVKSNDIKKGVKVL